MKAGRCTDLVDAHAEGDGGHDDPAAVRRPVLQRLRLRLALSITSITQPHRQGCMVDGGAEAGTA